jgi:predicted HAD superfamily phosphohydrolase YqeG
LNPSELDKAAYDLAKDSLLQSGVEGVMLELIEKLVHLEKMSKGNFRI